MEQHRINSEMTIFEVTEKYPETIQVFVDSGFPKLRDPEKRKLQGKALTVGAAAKMRKQDAADLIKRLEQAANTEQEQVDVTLGQDNTEMSLVPEGDIRISGLLPCPVRIPILEAVREMADRVQQQHGKKVGWSLSAAAVGADGLNAEIAKVQHQRDLPELFISAGFESFFDQRNLARFKDRDVFVDVAPEGQNAAFEGLQMRDPDGHFTMLGVVPAVFMINLPQLGDLPVPRTWADVLHPRYAGRVALPVGDFDLFNGLLLSLYQEHGEEGVATLASSMLTSMHPSQTVGRFAGRQQQTPAISIIPYFFSRMSLGSKVLKLVWPEDGAIACPIFMLVKRAALPLAGEVAELFLSKEVGQVLAHKGLFPVLNPEVDNKLPEGAKFRWLGWEFVREHDLGQLIPRLNEVFQRASGGDQAVGGAA